ncbi:hypothetical protein [Lelliottia jeotgali]
MAEPLYCYPFEILCQPLSWWASAASWAQALLSAAAIYFAALAATAPDKLAKRRKARSYLALLDIAEGMLRSCATQTPSLILVARLKQVTGQFAEVNVENVPDYRLLLPMQETHSALVTVSDVVERRMGLRNAGDLRSADELLQEMSKTYGDLLRIRKQDVSLLIDEIVAKNWFMRLAGIVRRG